MFRIYLGNLSSDVTEETLRGLFEEQGVVPVSNILLKRSFAFADCEDQETLDKAVDKLNGYKLLGFVMQVEPSMSRRRKTNKIQIKNLPANVTREDIEQLVSNTLGNAQKFEEVGAEGVVYVTFETAEQAQQAVAELHGYNLNGNLLKVELGNNRPRRTNNNNRTANTNNNAGMNRQEVPLRIVVGSEYVGAIIGKQGQTIKNITSQSRARVDIHRRDNHSQETLVTIKGSPENCTKACREIMKVVNAEAQALNKGECALKILCPNSLCGRIIGKKGAVIKGFMQESDTHIVVSSEVLSASNLPDMNNYYVDRIITITGSPEQASKAEELISEKMRACINQDAQLNYPGHQQMMFGGVQPSIPMVPNVNYRTQSQYHFMSNNMYPGLFAGATNINQPPQPQLEMIYLYIPENTVGAVIGSKGLNIKNIMRISGARIKIVQSQKNETNGQQNQIPAPRQSERKVIITGTPESQWKAQFYIFERVRAESMINEEIHLRAEILVPKSSIGRIIGKGGQNVKEMQRVSGAIVKLPEDQGDEEDVPVTIIGHFYAIQSAQRRIRSLMSNTPNLRPPRGPPRPQQNGN
ncbi:insulin-like growth factor 2 mRNA-binding protein 2 isoform X2 [Gigantopelta aegis]|uniref:insulin-like growth factor 2 mRNA-binding protein 2 isoform X2 n=1 Tax=Gigantopelta aegis TaxID=1735272 RepID=UPI001B8889FF|nr:insulin-like growth factor 2 mRNA-binding protein 2 isoform X2 [Gigantopelta aegis]